MRKSVLSFVKNLGQQFNTDELFLFQLVRSKTEVQLSLKLSSLSQPEVTREIVTQTCQQCKLEKLKLQVDIIVERMLDKIARADVSPQREAVASEKVAPLREEIALPAEVEKRYQRSVLSFMKRKLRKLLLRSLMLWSVIHITGKSANYCLM